MRFTQELHYVVTFFKRLCGNCRLYVSGRRLSVVGTRVQRIAMIRQVYRLTGRAFLLGMAGFVGVIGAVLYIGIYKPPVFSLLKRSKTKWTGGCFKR
ncbi:MAG TPA: hypothetical protein VFX43_14720 [Chitinophagaceae bacterium]|nr:hypothetical protein [Chitinophagaceae bacterium]